MPKNKKTRLPFYPQENPNGVHNLSSQKGICASSLLSRPHPEGYTEEWVESLRHLTTEDPIPTQSVLVFRIENEWLALPSHCVIEVTKASFIHQLPHTQSDVLLGITNVQGELLIAISLQNLLGIPNNIQTPIETNNTKYRRNVVFGVNKDIFAFPVDEIHGLCYLKPGKIGSVPLSISKSLKNFFSGIFTLPTETLSVGLLDEKLIINSLNENYL